MNKEQIKQRVDNIAIIVGRRVCMQRITRQEMPRVSVRQVVVEFVADERRRRCADPFSLPRVLLFVVALHNKIH